MTSDFNFLQRHGPRFYLALLLAAAANTSAQTSIFREGFDSLLTLPPGWSSTNLRHPGEDDATISTSTPHSPPRCVLLTNATLGQALTSPELSSLGSSFVSLSFYTRRSGSFGANVVVEALVGIDTIPLDTLRGTGNIAYVREDLPLAVPLQGATGTKFRWRILPDSAGTTGTFRVDDVEVSVSRVGSDGGSVVINEIMFAPTGEEPEWIELYNNSPASTDLAGWTIADATGTSHLIVSGPSSIPADGFLILTRDSSAFISARPDCRAPVIGVPGFPSLNNAGDACVLRDERGLMMDSMNYAGNWISAPGSSIERIDVLARGSEGNWGETQDTSGATPGLPNTIRRLDHDLRGGHMLWEEGGTSPLFTTHLVNAGRVSADGYTSGLYEWISDSAHPVVFFPSFGAIPPGDSVPITWRWENAPPGGHTISFQVQWPVDERPENNRVDGNVWVPFTETPVRINEIMAAPFSGDAEYIELSNFSDARLRLDDWRVNGIRLRAGTLIASDGYFVVAADSSIFVRFPYLHGSGLVAVAGASLGLNNEGDTVIVRDPTGRVADSVAYTVKWNNPAFADRAGRSLEKIRRNGASNDARNWSTCVNGAGGTPGRANSILAEVLPSATRLQCQPNPFSPDADGHDDVAIVQFTLPVEASLANISIYDVRGRLVRRLAVLQPVGPVGEVVWDGRDDRRRVLSIGPYVVYLEGLDRSGTVRLAAKCVVVLAKRL